MGDKSPVQRITFQDPPSRVSPKSKQRKKEPQEEPRKTIRRDPLSPTPRTTKKDRQKRKQTPAQRAASLRNLAKARAARGI